MTTPGDLSLQAVSSRLRSGDLSLLDYLAELESRFEVVEPQVHAFVPEQDRFARLREEAARLLQQYPTATARPPLFGVPVGVKDIYHVDGFVTRAGSRLDSGLLQGEQSEAISRVRAAGALILGKTVTTEFAYFAPGPTRNPHNLDHTPGGSSSGSAAAVAGGLCPLAFGTQTIGSINRPAAFCGVVGYKPSYDRISKAGILPLSPSADHAGFFVRQAADVAQVAQIVCGDWQPTMPDRPPVLAVPQGPYLGYASAEGLAHFEQTCTRLAEAGLALKRVPLMPNFADIVDHHKLIVAAEAALTHAQWYAMYGDLYHPKTVALIEEGQAVSDGALAEALAGRFELREALHSAMITEGIDLWLSPSAVGAAPRGLANTGDPVMNLPWSFAGLPSLTLPSGLSNNGLPLGLQVTGDFYQDELLLAWAPLLEKALIAG